MKFKSFFTAILVIFCSTFVSSCSSSVILSNNSYSSDDDNIYLSPTLEGDDNSRKIIEDLLMS